MTTNPEDIKVGEWYFLGPTGQAPWTVLKITKDGHAIIDSGSWGRPNRRTVPLSMLRSPSDRLAEQAPAEEPTHVHEKGALGRKPCHICDDIYPETN